MSNPNTIGNLSGAVVVVAGIAAGAAGIHGPERANNILPAPAAHHESLPTPDVPQSNLIAELTIPEQYDAAYDYVTDLPGTQPGVLDIPNTIIDPGIRTLTIKAADLALAGNLITEAYSDKPGDQVNAALDLADPSVRAEAVAAVAGQVFNHTLANVGNNEDISGDGQALAAVLEATDPKTYAADEKTLAEVQAAQAAANNDANNNDYGSDYQEHADVVTAAENQASDDVATAQDELSNQYGQALADITQGPKGKKRAAEIAAMEAQAAAGIPGCAEKPANERQGCIAGFVEADTNNNDFAAYQNDYPLLTDPEQQATAQAAAAKEAVLLMGIDDSDGFQRWSGVLTLPSAQETIWRGAAKEAVDAAHYGSVSDVSTWVALIPTGDRDDRMRVGQALTTLAAKDDAAGSPDLGNEIIAQLPTISTPRLQ